MYFYLFHHLMHHNESNDNDPATYNHGARNVRTLVFGGLSYIFTAAFLFSSQYQHIVQNVFVLSALRDWFVWVLALDILAMAIIYKLYWGDSIMREMKLFITKETDAPQKESEVTKLPVIESDEKVK